MGRIWIRGDGIRKGGGKDRNKRKDRDKAGRWEE